MNAAAKREVYDMAVMLVTLNGKPAAVKPTTEGLRLTVREDGEWVSMVVSWESAADAIESGAPDFLAVAR